MAWSTRQIAELAGTSLRAVRHYHEVGLLPEPERRANGYKQYGVSHLVRVLRIKRLTDLGFSLGQIADLGEADDHPGEALRTLDAELASTIDQLQRARVELGLILRRSVPTDLPADFVPRSATASMTAADRSLVVVLTRVLGPRGTETLAGMLQDPPTIPVMSEFDDLPEDAGEAVRDDVARRLAPHVRSIYADHPALGTAHDDAPGGARFARETMATAMRDVYNPAQLDVMTRVGLLLAEG